MANPTKSLKDPKFKYRNSAETDISVTFRRERKRLEALKAVGRRTGANGQKADRGQDGDGFGKHVRTTRILVRAGAAHGFDLERSGA